MKRLLQENKYEDDAPVCDACRYPVPASLLKRVNSSWDRRGGMLCPLCFGSLAGNAALYGESVYPGANAMLQSNFAANAILDHLGAFDTPNAN